MIPSDFRRNKPFRKGYNRTGGFYGRYNRAPIVGVKPELKFHDITIDDAVIAATGASALDSAFKITQGTGQSERIGRQLQAKSVNWRFQISLPAINATGAAPVGDTVRVLLYQDKQANGAVAGANEVVVDVGDWQTFNNLANTSRFRTLMDRTYNINYQAAAGSGGATDNDYAAISIDDTCFKKINFTVEYDGATNNITEIQSNNIGVILMSQNGTAGFLSMMRIRYFG